MIVIKSSTIGGFLMSATLEERMKRYEASTGAYLTPRMPVIVRVDGQAFKTFTRKFVRAYDSMYSAEPAAYSTAFANTMVDTAVQMAKTIQGCVAAYVQSDEISLLLRDWDTLETQPWFGYRTDKIVSSSAAKATAYFGHAVTRQLYNSPEWINGQLIATFDSRAFNVPKEDVNNYFVYRQQDTYRNCVQHFGRYALGTAVIRGKKNSEVIEMLAANGTPITSLAQRFRNGVLVYEESMDPRPKMVPHFNILKFAEHPETINDLLTVDNDLPTEL
jgi:tRNA(His) 5'-end guanylyltransferase